MSYEKEQERMKQDKTESTHFVGTYKDKGKRKKINVPKNEIANVLAQKKQKQDDSCFFCKMSDM